MLNRRFSPAVLITVLIIASTTKLHATGVQSPADSSKRTVTDSNNQLLCFDAHSLQLNIPDEMNSLAIPAIELNTEAIAFVKEYITKNSVMLQKIRDKNPSCFVIMDSVFRQYGLPVEIKYLAIIESQLKPTIVSPAGAVGAWQLMPATARNFSLKVSGKYDERKHFYKSTVAAAKYLTYLYEKFDDWLLVMAAYNGGPGSVYKAIKRSGSRDFWKMQAFLPKETRNHVKKFISTHYYYEQKGSIATLTKEEVNAYREKMMAFVTIQNNMPVKQIAKTSTPVTPSLTEEEKVISMNNVIVLKPQD